MIYFSKENIKYIFKKNGKYIKKSLGQNYLIDKEIINKIINTILERININKDKKLTLIEIGPGHGIITLNILKLLEQNTNVTYKIIEIEEKSINVLKENIISLLGESYLKKITIIHKDCMKLSGDDIVENTIIFVNLPYYISSRLLIFLIENFNKKIINMIFMFQKEVIDRIITKEESKSYGILSILPELFFEKQIIAKIPGSSFYPSPKIDSGVVMFNKKVDKYNIQDVTRFIHFIKIIFSKRRKNILNNIKYFHDYDSIDISKDNLTQIIVNNNIQKKRAEQMGISELIKIFNQI